MCHLAGMFAPSSPVFTDIVDATHVQGVGSCCASLPPCIHPNCKIHCDIPSCFALSNISSATTKLSSSLRTVLLRNHTTFSVCGRTPMLTDQPLRRHRDFRICSFEIFLLGIANFIPYAFTTTRATSRQMEKTHIAPFASIRIPPSVFRMDDRPPPIPTTNGGGCSTRRDTRGHEGLW